jgi:hypothetical protein
MLLAMIINTSSGVGRGEKSTYSSLDGRYTIWLQRCDDKVLIGTHCFVLYDGDLLDCNVSDETSIVMMRDRYAIDSNVYISMIVSEYREVIGVVNVRFDVDSLEVLTNDANLLYETAGVVMYREKSSR